MTSMTSLLSDAYSYVSWHRMNYAYDHCTSDVPSQALIASSQNLLQPNTFYERKKISLLPSSGIAEIVKKYDLNAPIHYSPAPLSNHCVSMSLNFLRKYYDSDKTISDAAEKMSLGADEECAKGTILYEGLIESNLDLSIQSEEEFLSKLRGIVANSLGLSFDKEIMLKMPLEEMFDYLNNKLEPGEYVIHFPEHLISLVKNESGVFLYNCNQGTVKLNKESKQWFLELLYKYKINRTETLSLLPVHGQTNDSHVSHNISGEVLSEKDIPPLLSFKPLEGRWEIAEFQFRGKVYHFVRDKETKFIYNDNSKKLIRLKLVLLTGKTLIDTALRTLSHAAMTALRLLALPLSALRGREKFLESLSKTIRSFFDIFRAPVYGLLGVGTAFYGVFKPYDGRRLYGYLERCLNRQTREVSFSKKYYVAPCFTPLNVNIVNKEDDLKNIEVLKQYAIRSDEFNRKLLLTLFCGWTRQIGLLKR